ncbi:MAG TPA: hypothetical protein VKZ43_05255 [Trueperaceae bacterium]|nr:hypothetical protein [Trueperaceae bacterium]
MLDSSPVRVGFVTQLLFARYGPFWRGLVAGAGATVVLPTREGVMAHWDEVDPDLAPGLWFRLAAAQASSLADCDLLVVPELNPEADETRGSAQDRWVADLPGALVDAVAGLPPLVRVATFPDPGIESRAVALLQSLLHDGAAVKRVWARHRADAAKPMPARSARSAGAAVEHSAMPTDALVGQPWAVTEAVAAAGVRAGVTGLSQLSIDSQRLRSEGSSFDSRLIATDAEVIGAARILSRRAGVTGLRFLHDETGSDAWLMKRVQQAVHKPVEPLSWREVAPDHDGLGAFLNLSVD